MRGTMRLPEIGVRTHLDQPRGRAVEFQRLKTFVGAVERVGLGGGGRDQLHVHVVERVDQDDEALRGVAVVVGHRRHMIENDGVIFAADAQIVGGRQRLFAQIVKGKARHPHGGARHVQAAALQRQVLRRAGIVADQPPPGLVERAVRRRIGRHGFRYTPTSTFETFPFPWQPGKEPQDSTLVEAIAEGARELVRQRDNWLNPPNAAPEALAKLTLTNLYNKRPSWLENAHRKLDEAVFAAYGWPAALTDAQLLERLLTLNRERAATHER